MLEKEPLASCLHVSERKSVLYPSLAHTALLKQVLGVGVQHLFLLCPLRTIGSAPPESPCYLQLVQWRGVVQKQERRDGVDLHWGAMSRCI